MATAREALLASRSAAMAAKDDFVQRFIAGHRDRSAGLGLNSDGDGWAVKVFVQNPRAADQLPKQFHGLAVEVEVTGATQAL